MCSDYFVVFLFFFFKQKTAYEIGVRLVGSEMCIRDRCQRSSRRLISSQAVLISNATCSVSSGIVSSLEKTKNGGSVGPPPFVFYIMN